MKTKPRFGYYLAAGLILLTATITYLSITDAPGK